MGFPEDMLSQAGLVGKNGSSPSVIAWKSLTLCKICLTYSVNDNELKSL